MGWLDVEIEILRDLPFCNTVVLGKRDELVGAGGGDSG
jgi:hypothetical protein